MIAFYDWRISFPAGALCCYIGLFPTFFTMTTTSTEQRLLAHLPLLKTKDIDISFNGDFEYCEDLSELPMTELLLRQRKHSNYNESQLPVADALINPFNSMQAKENPLRRGQWVEDEEPEEEEEWEWMPMSKGPGKVAKIFDMSVTALAFLAFGGYLLCLMVHAIKDKNNSTSMASTMTSPIQLQPLVLPSGAFQQFSSFRPGRKRREISDASNSLEYLIDSGVLFAEDFILLKP